MDPIIIVEHKKNERFLRTPTKPFDFSKFTKAEVRDFVKRMREAMRAVNGVGLSANQIGLPHRLFVAEVPGKDGMKFYAIFNPQITARSGEKMLLEEGITPKEKPIHFLSLLSKELETIEEGCLSVPRTYGPTPRHYRVTLSGFDAHGHVLKIKAWGLLARVFQHETDHLDGKLFVDKAERLIQINGQTNNNKQT